MKARLINIYCLQHVDFDASMTVNVTLMLCMVTVFTSMLNSLPKTSSVKMIDVWVVFNLMVPFFEIILQGKIQSNLSLALKWLYIQISTIHVTLDCVIVLIVFILE